MQIESIEPVSNNRMQIMLDTGEKFILYKGELRLLKIKGVGALSEEVYKQIVSGILPKRARFRAMNLLKSRMYTEYQLRRKLMDGGYPDYIVDQAISYVKQYGYVNDREYAIAFIEEQRSKRSRKEIANKLLSKGIEHETIDSAFMSIYGDTAGEDTETFDEIAVIEKALVKKGFTGQESYEEKQKLLGYFYRKGFSIDHVHAAMDRFRE